MRPRWARVEKVLEWPIVFLALLVVPALVLEERTTDPALRAIAHTLNWVVWVAFCVEFAVRWAADGRLRFLRMAWFDILLILLSPPLLVPQYLQGQ